MMDTAPNRSEPEGKSRRLFAELSPGDRIEVAHRVTIGPETWTTKTAGIVVRTERARHGLQFERNFDDKVFSDVVLLERSDGELTTMVVDDSTTIRRVQSPLPPGEG